MIHLSLLVRKLACTEAGSLIHHHRRLHLLVSCRCVDVKEVVDQSSLQSCTLALVHREAGTGELHSEVKVDDVILLCKLPVRKTVFSELRDLVTCLDHDIILSSLSLRNHIAWEVRQKHHERIQFRIVLLGLGLYFARACLQSGNFRLDSLGLFLPAFLHQTSDLGSLLLLLGQACVKLELKGSSVLIKDIDLFHYFLCVKILDCEFLNHELRILTEQF